MNEPCKLAQTACWRATAFAAVVLLPLISGCAISGKALPGSGASSNDVEAAALHPGRVPVSVIDLSEDLVRRGAETGKYRKFTELFSEASEAPSEVGFGDVLEVTIWESPPATLFAGTGLDTTRGIAVASARAAVLPEQAVGRTGTINVPFAGNVAAAGRAARQIEEDIARRLKGIANAPQVMVRVARNNSSMVTVVGEVATSTRLPLTARGERLLDALAAAGGTRHPVGRVTVQLTREVARAGMKGALVGSLPLDTVITDPAQNIPLQPGDVITVLHQPNSLMLLGATTRNEELNFEAQGITLAQALARAGGLQDQRANPEAVFIFRFEEPTVVGTEAAARTTPDGRVPVIYRVNLRDPQTFFTAQGFPMRNKDILYVSNAPAAELQKFLNIVSSVITPVFTIKALGN